MLGLSSSGARRTLSRHYLRLEPSDLTAAMSLKPAPPNECSPAAHRSAAPPGGAATRTLGSLICRFDFVSPAFQAPAMNLCDLSVTQLHRATTLKARPEKLLEQGQMSQRSL
jgi:hypothetical protein